VLSLFLSQLPAAIRKTRSVSEIAFILLKGLIDPIVGNLGPFEHAASADETASAKIIGVLVVIYDLDISRFALQDEVQLVFP
jgi:hypothetical protein